MTSQQRRDIDGVGRTIWDLFNNRRYAIDTYQREYKWQSKQVLELLNDLAGKFTEHYEPTQDRSEVAKYGHYFLGSVILSQKEGESYVIDGQQRLTTLSRARYLMDRAPCANVMEITRIVTMSYMGKSYLMGT